MDGKNLVTTNELVKLLQENQPDHPLFAEVKKVFEKADAEALYNAAAKADATSEDKIKWGAYTLELHQKLNAYLADVSKTPEKLNDEVIANVNNAYAINTHLCAEAIVKEPEGVVQELVNNSYERLSALGEYKPGGENAAAFETELAKILYLGKLKYEMENLHGSEEEMKEWKADILKELMSGNFENNVAKYKESPIYKESFKTMVSNPGMDPETAIQSAIVNMAEEKYHGIYSTFTKFEKSIEERIKEEAEITKVCAQLDEMRELADTVGIHRSGNQNKVETEYNTYLDTVTIKRRSALNGYVNNSIGFFREEERKERELEKRIRDLTEIEQKRYREEHPELMGSKELDGIQKELQPLFDVDRKINQIDKQYKDMSTNPKFAFVIKDPNLNPLPALFQTMAAEKNKKKDILIDLQKKYGVKAISEIDRNYDSYRKKTQEFDKKMEEIAQRVRERQTELEKDLRKLDEKEPEKIKEEAENYKKAVEENDLRTIEKIKESRAIRDNSYRRVNYQLYDSKFGKNEKGEFTTSYKPKTTSACVISMAADFVKFAKGFEDGSKVTDFFNENQVDFARKDILNHQNPPIERPDRKALTINAYKAPVVAELKAEDINVEENVERKFAESEPVSAPLVDYGDPSAHVTAALECAQRKAKIMFGTQEYKDILEGITKLRELMDAGADEKKVVIPLARKLDIMLNHYIDRKYDEKTDGKESTRARQRRENMEEAQVNLKEAINGLMQKNKVTEEDYVLDDLAADIDNVVKLTNKTNEEVKNIRSAIESKDRGTTFDLLYRFLDKRAESYYRDGQYNFLRGVYGETARHNIPSKADERMYKAVLGGYDKLLAARLSYMQKHDSRRLEVLKFNTKYISKEIGKDISVGTKFGVRTSPDYFALDLNIKKANTFEAYSKQFTDHYNGLATKMRYDSLVEKIKHPEEYEVTNILSQQDRVYMTEAALSAVFLNKNFADKEFNFEQTEEQRVKFISLMKSTNLFYRINENCMKVHDLKDVPGDEKELRDVSRERLRTVYEPKDFAQTVVVKSLQEEFFDKYNMVVENLGKEKDFNAAQLKEDVKALEMTCTIGKALGLSKPMGKVNENIQNEKYKGNNLEETLKKVKEAAAEKSMKKQIEPAKGIKI